MPSQCFSAAERLRRLEEAKALPQQHLATDPQPTRTLLNAARATGIATRTLQRAYEKLQKMHLCVGLIREARREPEAQLQMYRMVIGLEPQGLRYLTSVITGLGPDEPGAVGQGGVGNAGTRQY